MTSRRTAILFVAVWSAVVVATVWLLPAAFADRLPDPMATHWSGRAPDGSQSLTGFRVFGSVMYGAGALIALAIVLVRPQLLRHRQMRRMLTCGLAAWGGFFTGVVAIVVEANLDAEDWTRAELALPRLVVPLTLAATCAVAGWPLAGGRPDPVPEPAAVPSMRLAPGQSVMWSETKRSAWMLYGALGMSAAVLILDALTNDDPTRINYPLVVPLLIGLLLSVSCAQLRVTVGAAGVVVRFGLFGWPRWRIRLDDIDHALAEKRTGVEVGGWGLRIYPRGKALMLRNGMCLILRRKTRGEVTISVDDAETAAAALNGLLRRDKVPS